MDPRSWVWRPKVMEKSPGESESSEPVSVASEESTENQEELKASSNSMSPLNTKLSEDMPDAGDIGLQETLKSLTEKLSAALLDISAKEELVKQHAKVAEEAVSGWEQAENEVAALKEQLEATLQKNSTLEERISHLDEALKECVRKLRESREDQEDKLRDSIIKKNHEWESDKFDLEKKIDELKEQLETTKSEAKTYQGLQGILEAAEKENMDLKNEVLAQSKDIETLILEKDLSNQAAETASKQNLENIKKTVKLEAELRRLQNSAHKATASNDHRPIANSVCAESLTDSLSDTAERLPSVDTEAGCSESWATALIAELDQFKNENAASNQKTYIEIDLMDDFLEMERLVALPEADLRSSSIQAETNTDQSFTKIKQPEGKLEVLNYKLDEYKEQIERMTNEKAEFELVFSEYKIQLEASCKQLFAAENKLVELQRQLNLANESKKVVTKELVDLEAKSMELESKLKMAQSNAEKQQEKLLILEEKLENERSLSFELKARVDAEVAAKKAHESQLELVYVEIGAFKQIVGLLEDQVEEERALSSEYTAKTENLEAARRALESQLENAILEVGKMQEKVDILELKTEKERTISAESKSKLAAAEAARQTLELQLESANLEIKRLCDKIHSLEDKVAKERASSAELSAKCHKLDGELSRVKREAEIGRVANSNGELKIKKEKELAMAAGKLAECQKTIASLGQQLKSLTSLDEAVNEVVKIDCNRGVPDARTTPTKAFEYSDSSNTLNRASSASSPSSAFTGLTKLLSRNKNSSRVET